VLRFKPYFSIGFLALLVLSLTLVKPVFASNNPSNIIIINSYNNGFKWTDDQVKGIIETLQSSNNNIIIYTEYLDWKNFPNTEVLEKQFALFQTKYTSIPIDLIITTDDAAMQFAIDYRDELFNHAPIIFGSVNKESALKRMEGVDKISGVYENIDTEGTAELIQAVHKDVKIVYAITENTESGRSTWNRIKEGFDTLDDSTIKLINLNDKSYQDLKDILKNPEKNSVAVLASYSTDINGLIFSPIDISKEFAMLSQIPLYILHDNSLNEMVMGGSLLSGYLHGVQTAKLAIQFLNGSPIEEINVDDSIMASKVINYNPLQKYELAEVNIPGNYIIVNRPFSFYETYKPYIYLVSFTFLILISLVAILYMNVKLRKKTQKDLFDKHLELSDLYELVSGSEEELKAQNDILIEQQQLLKESEEKYRLTSESANDINWIWDIKEDHKIIEAKLYQLLDYEPNSLDTQEKWYSIVHPEDIDAIKKDIEEYFTKDEDKLAAEYRIRNKKGEYIYVLSTGKGVKDIEGNYVKMYGTYTDITQAKLDHDQIVYLAYNDYLTNLPNRLSIKKVTEELIATINNEKMLVYFIDLDNFKFINNSFGHQVGDWLLIEVSRRLNHLRTPNVHVGRIGGDEFIIVIHDINHNQELFTKKLEEIFKEPFNIYNRSIYSTASIGYVIYPEDGETYDDLLIKADMAMYKVKEYGKSQIARFAESMNDEMAEKIEYQNHLRNAIENNEFFIECQPLFMTEDQSVNGFEVLLRWENPILGRISPMKFIPLAESGGLIIPIGLFVLKKAFQFAKKINEEFDYRRLVAVNISVVQLFQSDFVEQVDLILKEVNVDPTLIEFEVTESIYAENFDVFRNQLLKIKKLGINISLDDFGTGYSSLTYLRMLPISTLKIDKKFIDDILSEKEDHILVETIIDLGHKLKLRIVAEGVEKQEQFDYLKEHKCQLIQGYLFSKPLSEEDCFKLLGSGVDVENF